MSYYCCEIHMQVKTVYRISDSTADILNQQEVTSFITLIYPDSGTDNNKWKAVLINVASYSCAFTNVTCQVCAMKLPVIFLPVELYQDIIQQDISMLSVLPHPTLHQLSATEMYCIY